MSTEVKTKTVTITYDADKTNVKNLQAGFDKKVPTALTVIILSLILCPVCLLGLAAYYGVAIEWFMVFASFIAAFIVALVSMDGWERVTELAEKLIRKK